MAKPRTRQQLIDFCLRSLGHPVIEINVDEDQLDDRVDDALQFFAEYHFDGVEKTYLKYIVQQEDIDNGYINMVSTNNFVSSPGASGQNESNMTMTESGQTGTVQINDTIASIIQIFHVGHSSFGMFDVRYQYALNDLYTFGSIDLINYTVTMQYFSLLKQILSPDKSIRFSRRSNKLYIDTNWTTQMKPGDYLVIEAYRVMDPKVFPEIYEDMLLKKYLTQLIKRQWGANLSKFNGIKMIGGVTFNGAELWAQANTEIEKIETSMQTNFETGPSFFVG